MIIRNMFQNDINRKINGVIKVDQSTDDVLRQEVSEYVITKELKKHFITFFNNFCDAIDTPTADIGVWISGFFGSGKSHFLKMLSYILQNKDIDGVKTVEYFREKFSDDPATFMLIDKATREQCDTILFNIDIEGSINKDKTAVLRVFAKTFFNHLGFYGDNLKVALLEKYIDKCGKTAEFRAAFEKNKGMPWLEQRKAFAFNGKYIIPALTETLGMSEEDAKNWFNDKTGVDYSIAQLVDDIKEYIAAKPAGYRLLFMVDEAGQYVGTDTNLLLNLQSIIEKIGSECGGKVWVVCTGQEAIDEIIKVRADEFSRIQARFKTRLSLTSSSVDEVIQKRILKKKPDTEHKLEELYNDNDSILRNLFTFTDSVLDIKGYGGPSEFAVNYPFVPYQFIVMQKVFSEIRKRGNAGKHLAGGERSMLSGFQEAAQKVQDCDEYTLVPFYRFYDTVHSFLDGAIRRVIDRCQDAADSSSGIEQFDVNVLKLLYLVRYIDDIKSTLDNLVILMADDIRIDKIVLREAVRNSLDRLLSQNYIGRTGDVYSFLTDEEQDIQREIKSTVVDTSSIVEKIANIVYGDIYTSKKYRYGKYDFSFDQMVDSVMVGNPTGGMRLRLLTVATDTLEKAEVRLMSESTHQAIVVLADNSYFDSVENALKIRKYVKQRNVTQLPKSVQDIIRDRQDEASQYELKATDELKKAIQDAEFFVDGEHLNLKAGDAKTKLDQSLEYLVSHVYSELGLIEQSAEDDADIQSILSGTCDEAFDGLVKNQGAAEKIEEFLEIQEQKNLPTSMADIQQRYQAIPYGWREIDIAMVVAQLIHYQKITVKYAGNTIQPSNPKLIDMLRKKSEIGKTIIKLRQSVTASSMKEAKEFLRDYFDVMDVPEDEDGLVAFIVEKFGDLKGHYDKLLERYEGKNYPDKAVVENAVSIISDLLSQQKDNIALVTALIKKEDDLYDSKDAMQNVDSFFKTQVQVYDSAVKMLDNLKDELDYLSHEQEANNALNRIRLLTVVQTKFDYKCIPELNTLMKTVREGHNRLLEDKRAELRNIVEQCMAAIHGIISGNAEAQSISNSADAFFAQKKQKIDELESLALLDGLVPPMIQYKDNAVSKIEVLTKPVQQPEPHDVPTAGAKQPKKIIKAYNRQVVFPAKRIESQADLDSYMEQIKKQLKTLMQNCDGIEIK